MVKYIRRKSTPLDVAKTRWQGLVSQDPAMDLGNGLSVQAFGTSIAELDMQLLKVNNLGADIQTERAKLVEMEREMRDLNDRYMKATAAKYIWILDIRHLALILLFSNRKAKMTLESYSEMDKIFRKTQKLLDFLFDF